MSQLYEALHRLPSDQVSLTQFTVSKGVGVAHVDDQVMTFGPIVCWRAQSSTFKLDQHVSKLLLTATFHSNKVLSNVSLQGGEARDKELKSHLKFKSINFQYLSIYLLMNLKLYCCKSTSQTSQQLVFWPQDPLTKSQRGIFIGF